MSIFERVRTVLPEHIDGLGHVNNEIWLRFVMDLAQAHCRSLHLDPTDHQRHGGVWVVRRHELEYLRPALPGDELLEQTWVTSMRGAQSQRRFRFLRRKDGEELVRASSQWAFCDPVSMRPRRIARSWLDAIPVLEAAPAL